MPHFPKPSFCDRNRWYVKLDGKQVNLGPDRDAAFKAYHELTAARTSAEPVKPTQLVVVVIDELLEWCQKHRSPDTYRWYKDRLNAFRATIPADLAVKQFRPFHVQKWVDGQPDLSSGSRRNLVASVKRAMRWTEEQGYVERSPVAHMRKPACGRKEQVVSPAEFKKLLARTKDQKFKDLLTVTWETGARPQETLRVEARHADLAGQRWLFPASEAKGGELPRVVYLTDAALDIASRPRRAIFCRRSLC